MESREAQQKIGEAWRSGGSLVSLVVEPCPIIKDRDTGATQTNESDDSAKPAKA